MDGLPSSTCKSAEAVVMSGEVGCCNLVDLVNLLKQTMLKPLNHADNKVCLVL